MSGLQDLPGIAAWALEIRMSMINDRGRQTLEDEIQVNGFDFLQNYLSDILAGPKRDPIFELVKTPGRKKDAPKRTRAATTATAKLNAVINGPSQNGQSGKENVAPKVQPINGLHETLLQAAQKLDQEDSDTSGSGRVLRPRKNTGNNSQTRLQKGKKVASKKLKGGKIIQPPSEDDGVEVDEIHTSPHSMAQNQSPTSDDNLSGSVSSVSTARKPSQAYLQIQTNPSHLSIITEDDEDITSAIKSRDGKSSFKQRVSSLERRSISIESKQPLPAPSSMSDTIMSVAPIDEPRFPQPSALSHSKSLPVGEELTSGSIDHVTASNISPPRDLQMHAGKIPLPRIGKLSPLRKSVRDPREVFMFPSQAVQPQAGPGLKRSSWLTKAREANAMEEGPKKSNTLGPIHFAVPTSSNPKRKSGEMSTFSGDFWRSAKVPKLSNEPLPQSIPLSNSDFELEQVGHREMDVIPSASNLADARTWSKDHAIPDGLDLLMKKVEGYHSRAGKSMGKSLGGAAVQELAEAMAAAEAKVAERLAAEGRVLPSAQDSNPIQAPSIAPLSRRPSALAQAPVFRNPTEETHRDSMPQTLHSGDRRLSLSELISNSHSKQTDGYESKATADISTSTTPPYSPDPPMKPLKKVPEPVFTREPSPPFNLPLPTFTIGGIPANISGTNIGPSRLLSQMPSQSSYVSTQSSTYPDSIFDNDGAWLSSTQDTAYSQTASQEKDVFRPSQPMTESDMDESWHVDEKLAAEQQQFRIGMGENDDSMTWSTLPTRSQGSRGRPSQPDYESAQPRAESQLQKHGVMDVLEDIPLHEETEAEHAPGTLETRVHKTIEGPYYHQRNVSQSSVSTTQSQSQVTSFLGTASRFVSSVLNGSKKGKGEPLKSLQLAAAAAVQQQKEIDKKAVRLREMEARRQQAAQRKAEEDRLREEKRIKEENERRKREREKEEIVEKKVSKLAPKKVYQSDDDSHKKRKVGAESDKQTETKRPLTKDKKEAGTSRIGKPNLGGSTLSKSGLQSEIPAVTFSDQSTTKAVASATSKSSIIPSKSLASAKGKEKMEELACDPSVEDQTRPNPIEAHKPEAPSVKSESIVLPDINSEYSDSEDEDRVRTFDPPSWAKSPVLRSALVSQSAFNPDDIFGAIKPLRMEEMFKTRTSRFRARTSSANWSGADKLTVAEERAYAKRMGYIK